MHSTYRLATHELQDDKLSVRKATLPCKKQGFLTLGALRPGLTPPVYPCWKWQVTEAVRINVCEAFALLGTCFNLGSILMRSQSGHS